MTARRSFQKLRQPLAGSTCGFRFRLLRLSRTMLTNGGRRNAVTCLVLMTTRDAAAAVRLGGSRLSRRGRGPEAALAISVAAEDAKEQIEQLVSQEFRKSGKSNQINIELQEIVFVIQSQSNSFHSKRAEDLESNILKQAEELGKELPRVLLIHQMDRHDGAWTILPLMQ
ncbi:hypothetical protein KIL84_019399, partial [Mauremys mutica]